MIVGIVALTAFLFMGILTVFRPAPKAVQVIEKPIDSTEVLVARTDLSLGQFATQSHFRWQSWPTEAVSPAFIPRQRIAIRSAAH